MSEKEKPCMTCEKLCFPLQRNEEAVSKNLIYINETVICPVNARPNSKFHFNVITKRHTEDLRTLTDQEWADILPCLKDGINKIENYYQQKGKPGPLGYRISIPNGELAAQNIPQHFYLRVVPKYQKNLGSTMVPASLKYKPSPGFTENKEKIRASLNPNQDKVIAEKGKLVAKLHEDDKSVLTHTRESLSGNIVISTKAKLANDISAIDQETWNEIGALLRELMKKMEAGADCHSFLVEIIIGKETVKTFKEECEITSDLSYSDSELIVNLIPRYKLTRIWDGSRPVVNNTNVGTMENDRLAWKLNDPQVFSNTRKINKSQELNQLKEQLVQTRQSLASQQQELTHQQGKVSPLWLLLIIPVIGITAAVVWFFAQKKKNS